MAKVDTGEVVAVVNLILTALEKLTAIVKEDPKAWEIVRDDWRKVSSGFDDAVNAEVKKRAEDEK